jgi:hypothetical protein
MRTYDLLGPTFKYAIRNAKGNARRSPQSFMNTAEIVVRHVQADGSGVVGELAAN